MIARLFIPVTRLPDQPYHLIIRFHSSFFCFTLSSHHYKSNRGHGQYIIAMADKEATVYIVDVGHSMGKKRNGRRESDLDWAMTYVWDKITSTVRETMNDFRSIFLIV